MKFVEAIKQAEPGDVIELEDTFHNNPKEEEPWSSFVVAKNGDLICVCGMSELNTTEFNSDNWRIKK